VGWWISMVKVIKQIKVDDRQLALLQQYKEQQFALKKEVHSDIFPALIEGLRQIRELEQNIAIIAGAIASFTIPVVNTSFVQVKFLAYLALVFLFTTICYAIYHLSEVTTKEVNELSKQHSTYNKLIDEVIDRINTVIESGDVDKLVDFDKQDVIARLDELKKTPKPDKSLDRLKLFLFIALGSLVLSFIPMSGYLAVWHVGLQFFSLFKINN
jgi:hypothetical protein